MSPFGKCIRAVVYIEGVVTGVVKITQICRRLQYKGFMSHKYSTNLKGFSHSVISYSREQMKVFNDENQIFLNVMANVIRVSS